MPTIVWGDIPTGEFALQQTFEVVPDAVFECEQVVENGHDVVMPMLWGRASDPGELDVALENDPSVGDVEKLAELDGEVLYRMEWVRQVELVLQMMLNDNGTVLDAYGNSDRWRLRIFYPDREELSETNEFCEKHDLPFDVRRVRDMDSEPASRYGLTDEQYESLKRAWESGYFDVPRETGIEDLADELDISHQALSERLRRGHNTLVENMLGISVPE
jgi:predicted DNA binding protein